MRRRLFNLAAGVSLVLCVVTAWLWWRGTGTCDMARFVRGPTVYEARFGYRELCLSVQDFYPKPYSLGPGWQTTHFPTLGYFVGNQHELVFAGFAHGIRVGTTGPRHYMAIPYWQAMAVLSMLPFVATARRVAQQKRDGRQAQGLCPTCGYDLRATPDRCPECGTVRSA